MSRVNTGIIVYDIFGRVLQMNELMLTLLKKEGLAPFELTILDLILALTDNDISRSRKLLRHVIVDSASVSFPVTLRSASNTRYLLSFKPLTEAAEDDAAAAMRRVGVRTVLCELVDTTVTAHLQEMKSHLAERMGLRLRSELAAIDVSSSLLEDGTIDAEQRKAIAGIVRSKVESSVATLAECRRYLAVETDGDLERFPVDPRGALDEALDGAREDAGRRGVTLRLEEPAYPVCVFAASRRLRDLFGSILALLIRDAGDGTAVLVRVVEGEDAVAFDFANQGFGIPNDILQQYMFGAQAAASAEFRKVQEATKWVEGWGGLIEAASAVGVGLRFTVHLVKFT
jgi:signal transduction histidine kinase